MIIELLSDNLLCWFSRRKGFKWIWPYCPHRSVASGSWSGPSAALHTWPALRPNRPTVTVLTSAKVLIEWLTEEVKDKSSQNLTSHRISDKTPPSGQTEPPGDLRLHFPNYHTHICHHVKFHNNPSTLSFSNLKSQSLPIHGFSKIAPLSIFPVKMVIAEMPGIW